MKVKKEVIATSQQTQKMERGRYRERYLPLCYLLNKSECVPVRYRKSSVLVCW